MEDLSIITKVAISYRINLRELVMNPKQMHNSGPNVASQHINIDTQQKVG